MWANNYIKILQAGEIVKFRPKGNSMVPKIKSGQLVTVKPVIAKELKVGTIVLCQVGRNQYLHLISDISNGLYQISNNKGFINGRIPFDQIFGILANVEP